MRLLKESVVRIWKARKAAVREEIATVERAAKAIQEKLDRLDEAFLFLVDPDYFRTVVRTFGADREVILVCGPAAQPAAQLSDGVSGRRICTVSQSLQAGAAEGGRDHDRAWHADTTVQVYHKNLGRVATTNGRWFTRRIPERFRALN